MNRCKKCLYPDTTKPFIHFDDEGVCSGCRVSEEKKNIDWEQRGDKLVSLIEPFKKESGYDCIIPVSGGKDSTFQVHYAVKELGLRPLLVTFNHLDNSEVGIRNLQNLVVKFGLDHIRFTPSPEVVKKCCRHATKKMGDPFWHEHAGIYTFPVKIAALYKIPLILWGEHGFSDLTGMYSFSDFLEMSKKNREEHGMRGMDAQAFIEGNEEGLTIRDLEFTEYPSDEVIEEVGIRGIYLSNYIDWDSIKQTNEMIELYDFETDEKERTFNIYENVECYYNDTVHDYMKYLKFGYGRATDHISQLIRLGYLDRDYGLYLVEKYDRPEINYKFIEFCEWMEMDYNEVIEILKSQSKSDVDFSEITKLSEIYRHNPKNRRVRKIL